MSLRNAAIQILNHEAVGADAVGRHIQSADLVRDIMGRAGQAPAQTLCALNTLRRQGAVSVALPCAHPDMQAVAAEGPAAMALCAQSPALWNVYAYAREWDSHPEYNDFMNPASPAHHRKTFQGEIYAKMLAPWIERLDAASRVLDAGAGVGRMAPHLARTGARLDLADASERALLCAWDTLCRAGARDYDLHWRGAHDLDCFATDSFDLVLALELLCYLDEPTRAAAELARVCRPGGVVAFSVENKAGAIFGDPHIEAGDISALLTCNELVVPEYIYVNYHTADAAAALAVMAGLEIRLVAGCHFLADGPFHALATEEMLANPQKRTRAHAVENACREHAWLRRFARAWLVVAQKPEAESEQASAPCASCGN
jgi:SAM-dependent methyltransferase